MDTTLSEKRLPTQATYGQKRPNEWFMIISLLLAVSVLLVISARISIGTSLQQVEFSGQHLLELYKKVLHSELQRHAYLPLTLSRNQEVIKLLQQPRDQVLASDLNRYLEQISEGTDALAVYLLDVQGTTLASSNWRTRTSYVGQNYSFRPYFQTALLGQSSYYFAIGATTGVPGLFISYPVQNGGQVIGVVSVKVSMKPLEQTWAENSGEVVFLTDAEGVIFSSSKSELLFHTLTELPIQAQRQLQDGRKYNGVKLHALGLYSTDLWGVKNNNLVSFGRNKTIKSQDIEQTQLIGRYLLQKTGLESSQWTLHILSDLSIVNGRLGYHLLATLSLLMLALMVVVFLIQARQNQKEKERLEAQAQLTLQKANDELEHRVELRSQALKKAQQELIQASKLAALGQMSAGIAHELNQPLGALRTFASSGTLLIERQQYALAQQNFERISSLAERIGLLTSQLKVLARKEHPQPIPVELAPCIQQALEIIQAKPESQTIRFLIEPSLSDYQVLAEPMQLEQVLINLLNNAVYAVSKVSDPEIILQIRKQHHELEIQIIDNGEGFKVEQISQLFDPFFTTKPVGEGLGLGLSLVNGMVQGWQGRVQATPLAQGAMFSLFMTSADTKGKIE